jgi:hypothetical protein
MLDRIASIEWDTTAFNQKIIFIDHDGYRFKTISVRDDKAQEVFSQAVSAWLKHTEEKDEAKEREKES